MTEGIVKFSIPPRVLASFSPECGGKDGFVHISAVERAGMSTLHEGQKLGYELETGRDGKQSAVPLTEL
jgi:CspA family cold shock protein